MIDVALLTYLGLAAVPAFLGLTLIVLVALPYSVFERRHRTQWRKLATRRLSLGGPYRRTHVRVDPPKRAPFLVRAAALSCFFLGAACVPLATTAFSLVVDSNAAGVVLLVPALVLLRLWIAGARLLEPDVDSLQSVRTATRWLVHATFPVALASLPLWLFVGFFPAPEHEGVTLVLALGAFSIVCLAECALLARASLAAAKLLPDEAADRVRSTPAIPMWMNRVIARKLLKA
jgi:hypothetical protein